mmetsp:Transcript_7946/g.33428  ORF Transcript_7946/g.33428 Transcript_7946/m.33428 type:complete len:1282 (+) Transcript_7946:71-3916(+)
MVLYISLKVIGEAEVGKHALASALSTGEKENDGGSEAVAPRRPTEVKLRIGGRRCKFDLLEPQVAGKFIDNASWSKVNGFIFMYDVSEPSSVESIMATVEAVKKQQSFANLPAVLLANKSDINSAFTTSQVRDFCTAHKLDLFEVSCAPNAKDTRPEAAQQFKEDIKSCMEAFVASVATTIPAESPKKSRRRSLRPPMFKNEISQGIASAVAAVPALNLSNQTAKTETVPASGSTTPKKGEKKSRRRSILGIGVKTPRSRRREKRRRETLMGAESDSSCSDSSDGEMSDSETSGSVSLEAIEGSHQLEEVLEFMLFSPSASSDLRDRFFLTYWKFTSGKEILGCLRKFWRGYPQPLPGHKQRVASFLVDWVRSAPLCDGMLDDQELIKELELFEKNVSQCSDVGNADQLGCELARLPALVQSDTCDSIKLAVDPVEAIGLHRKYKPVVVAQQLTLLHSNCLLQVKPYELLRKVSSSSTAEDYPNLMKMITQNTSLSHWVSREVLQQDEVKERSKTIRYFIDVASICKELQNYNAVMAITGALGSSPISRLHNTWEEVGKSHSKKLSQLTTMMITHNSREYRQALATATPPCVPFPGTWITDLVKIHESSSWTHVIEAPECSEDAKPTKLALVNLSKVKQASDTLRQLQRFQEPGCRYGFETNRELQAILRNLPSIDEDEAWARSYELESSRSVGSVHMEVTGENAATTSFQAYSLAASYSGSLDGKLLSHILEKEDIDMELLTKLQQRARDASDTAERVALLNKWVSKGTTDRVFQETLAASDACDVLLANLMCYSGVFPTMDQADEPREKLPASQLAALNQAISSLFHTLVVGDKENMQQLLTLMKTTLTVCETEVAARHIRQLFSCYKFPQHYRTIHAAIKERRADIAKINAAIEAKDQSSFKEDPSKEAARHRKAIEATQSIVQLYVEIEQLIALKEEKKLAMCARYRNVMAALRAELSSVRKSKTKTIGAFSNSLEKIRDLEEKNASSYRRTVCTLDARNSSIVSEMKECQTNIAALEAQLQQERDRLANLEKQKARIDKKRASSKKAYTETKTKLSEEARAMCSDLSVDQGTSQAMATIQGALGKLDRYLQTVIGLEQHQLDVAIRSSRLCTLTHTDSIIHGHVPMSKSEEEVVLTEPQREQHTETMQAEMRYFAEVRAALLQLEETIQQLHAEMTATVKNLSLLNSSGLQQKMLKGEFNYVKHVEKAKALRKRLRQVKKDVETLTSTVDEELLHNSEVEGAKRCGTLLFSVQQSLRQCAKSEGMIDSEITKSQAQ